jgi:2-haloacid dehalogenase
MAAVRDVHMSDPEVDGSTRVLTSAPSSTVRAVIFDLGNVLITWNPHRAIAKVVGEEQATLFLGDEDFAFMDWNHQQDAGRSWDEGEEAAVISHPHWELAIRAYREHFTDSLTGAIDDSVQILRELHAAHIPLYALTNWSMELFPVARGRFEFLDLFEDIVMSGEEGVGKPDPAIFEILRKRIGHQLHDCVFIDDSQPNIEAAGKAGLDAILFTDTGHLREDLVSRGLPLAPT